MNAPDHKKRRNRQLGLTLMELLVSVVMALFMAGALMVIFVTLNRDFNNQDQVTQLEDSERSVRSQLTATLQHAGYYPSPQTNSPTLALPIDEVQWTPGGWVSPLVAGQSVSGWGDGTGTGANSDLISVRFQTADGDGLLNCNGTSNQSGGPLTYINTFAINNQNQLICSLNNQPALVLANNVARMTILYGTDFANLGRVDTYMSGTAVQRAGLWPRVLTVLIRINFLDTTRSKPGAPVATAVTTTQLVSLKGKQ